MSRQGGWLGREKENQPVARWVGPFHPTLQRDEIPSEMNAPCSGQPARCSAAPIPQPKAPPGGLCSHSSCPLLTSAPKTDCLSPSRGVKTLQGCLREGQGREPRQAAPGGVQIFVELRRGSQYLPGTGAQLTPWSSCPVSPTRTGMLDSSAKCHFQLLMPQGIKYGSKGR